MSLFDRLYYGKAGKKDYTEMDMPKNRISLFFQVLKDHLFDLFKVNLLQIGFWLPFLIWTFINLTVIQHIDTTALLASENGSQELINTVGSYVMMWLLGAIPCLAITGPSSAGAAYVMRNWARDQHAFLFSDFKDAFKGNWKHALATSTLNAFVPIFTFAAITYYGSAASKSVVMFLPLILVLSVAFLWILMLPLIYPMMIGYELKFKSTIKNAAIMAAASLPKMIFARFVTFIPIIILLIGLDSGNAIMIMGVSIYYLFFGFAFSRLVYASVANGVFDKFLNPHIEGAEVRQGLRPQTDEDELFDDDDDEDDEEYEEDA